MESDPVSMERIFYQALEKNNIVFSTTELIQKIDDPSDQQLADISRHTVVNDQFLLRGNDLLWVIYPAGNNFNLEKLSKALACDLVPLSGKKLDSLFPQNRPVNLPPLNQSPGMHIILDEQLSNNDSMLYRAGESGKAYIVNMDDFYPLVSDAVLGISFSDPAESGNESDDPEPGMNLREQMKRLHELPPLPATADKLLTLRSHYEVNTDYLIRIIENDPVLAAQVISYANSAFFGQSGAVKTLKDAIFRVLGVNAVIDLALGLSLGRTLAIPQSGQLGAQRLWRHATYSAAMMQKLATLMPWGERPEPGTAYLAGLLHDLGYFILAYLFDKQHQSLSRLMSTHTAIPAYQIEQNLLGFTHCDLGYLAMRTWNMPDEITTVARFHHRENYRGEHQAYVWLLNLVEHLLAPQGLSYTASDEISEELLKQLGLNEEDVILAADEVIQAGGSLDMLAAQMCA